jgi:hypothetical protein
MTLVDQTPRERHVPKEQTMKLARVGVIAAAVLAVATLAFAQAKPDFSGTWTPDVPADAAAGGGGGRGMGGPMTVKHTGDTLTVERTGRGGNTTTQTYKLDGSETKVMMGQNEATATAKWDGNKIVIATKFGENANTQTWSLEGGVLTIDRTGGRGPSSTKYKKS